MYFTNDQTWRQIILGRRLVPAGTCEIWIGEWTWWGNMENSPVRLGAALARPGYGIHWHKCGPSLAVDQAGLVLSTH